MTVIQKMVSQVEIRLEVDWLLISSANNAERDSALFTLAGKFIAAFVSLFQLQ